MTAIVVGETPPALREDAETTADRLGRLYADAIAGGDFEPATIDPGLSREAIAAEHGPETAYMPKWQYATFRAPMGIRMPQYESLRDEKVGLWIAEMARMGWDLDSGSKVHCAPGPYPSRDLGTNLEVPGYRDILVAARFVERNPVVRRIEVETALFEPTTMLDPPPHQKEGA
jgi:hypothetical protein